MLSIWTMAKGRIIAAIVAALLGGLALIGFDVVSAETINAVTVFATALVTFVQFLAYGVFHLFVTKRKLTRGDVAEENIEQLTPTVRSAVNR